MSHREVYKVIALLVIGALIDRCAQLYRPLRIRWLRWRVRRKAHQIAMARLRRTIPVIAVLWAGVEVGRCEAQVVAQPADSLIGTVLSRSAIGQWDGTVKVYCLTWVSEIPSRPHVLIVVDAVAADTTLHPICPNPEGGYYPMWLDGPTCPPGQVSPFEDRDFVIVRCGADVLARYRKRQQPDRRAQ